MSARKNLLFTVICFLSVQCPLITWAAGTSGWGKITQVRVPVDGKTAKVSFSESYVNPDGCELDGMYIAYLQEGDSGDRFLSALLAAQASQAEVSMYISGCTAEKFWGGTRPKVYDIYIGKP